VVGQARGAILVAQCVRTVSATHIMGLWRTQAYHVWANGGSEVGGDGGLCSCWAPIFS
jgi:hypothetical protein